MSDTSQGPGWWLASDGKWYPPDLHPDAKAPERGADRAEGPGWWLASDGRWYPPELRPGPGSRAHPASAATSQGSGWWLASDGRWYPPELHPDALVSASAGSSVAVAEAEAATAESGSGVEAPVVETPAAPIETPVVEPSVVEPSVVEEPSALVEDEGPPTDPVPVVTEEPGPEPRHRPWRRHGSTGEAGEVPAPTAPEEVRVEEETPSSEEAVVSDETHVVADEAEPPTAAAAFAFTQEPSRRARRRQRRRRTGVVAAAVVVLAGVVAAAIVLSGSTTPSSSPRPRVTTTLPHPAAATGWTASDVHVVGGPVVAGNRVLVVDAAGDGTTSLAAVDPRTGKVVWQQPYAVSAVPPGVLVTPVAIGTVALDVAPSTGPTDPSVVLKGIDVTTGQPTWTSSAPAVVVDAPVVCAAQRRFCVDVAGTGGSSQLEQIDPANGSVAATLAGPHTEMATNLYETQAQPPGFVAVSDAGGLVWSKSVAALFGGGQFSPQYGYDFVNAGALDVGTVGVAPSAGGTLALGSFETIGVDATSGAVAWIAPGALDCFGVIPVTPQFLCRYSGSGTYVNGSLSTTGVTLTLEGLNTATGAVTWSVPVAQAQALTTGNGVPVADADHIVVPLTSGPALLDLVSGQTTPVPAGALFWCGQSQQASVRAPASALSGGRRVAASLFGPCTAEGGTATSPPNAALPAIGVSIDGLFVWPSAAGLEASPTPR